MADAENIRARETTARIKAAYARAAGASQVAAAAEAGCSPRSIYTWETQNDPAYWAAFDEGRRNLKRGVWAESTLVLREALRSSDVNVRIKAASKLLDSADREYPQKHEHSGEGGGAIGIVLYLPELAEEEDDEA